MLRKLEQEKCAREIGQLRALEDEQCGEGSACGRTLAAWRGALHATGRAAIAIGFIACMLEAPVKPMRFPLESRCRQPRPRTRGATPLMAGEKTSGYVSISRTASESSGRRCRSGFNTISIWTRSTPRFATLG